MILNNFYRGKKVLITGHTGFKGSWLTLALHRLGAEISGIALEPKTSEDFYVVNRLEEMCDSHICDISGFGSVREIISGFQPDLVFHLAAQPLVRYSYNNPLETFQTNVMGTANILEAVKSIRSRCAVVVITTDKVYENHETGQPYLEADRLGGHDPYSASKACSEMVAASFRQSFFPPERFDQHQKAIATARAGNVIGGGDWAEDRLVPDIVRAIRSGEEIIIRNPDAVRPWQHVLDPLYGYLMLGKALYEDPSAFSGAWNFGPEPGGIQRVEEVVKTAIRLLGRGNYRIQKEVDAPREAGLLRLDITKAAEILKWQPLLGTGQAIEQTLAWYGAFLEGDRNMREYSINAVQDYFNLLTT